MCIYIYIFFFFFFLFLLLEEACLGCTPKGPNDRQHMLPRRVLRRGFSKGFAEGSQKGSQKQPCSWVLEEKEGFSQAVLKRGWGVPEEGA